MNGWGSLCRRCLSSIIFGIEPGIEALDGQAISVSSNPDRAKSFAFCGSAGDAPQRPDYVSAHFGFLAPAAC